MARYSHPSLPHIFGVNLTQNPYFLVSYFYDINIQTCTLYNTKLYCPTIPFTKYSAGKIMFELCQALQHLHMKQLLHQNIKSDNILLTTMHTGFHPMLIDFGKSIEVSEATSKRKCLIAHEQDDYRKKYRHIAPEIIFGQPPSFASDVFSFGVVVWYQCQHSFWKLLSWRTNKMLKRWSQIKMFDFIPSQSAWKKCIPLQIVKVVPRW